MIPANICIFMYYYFMLPADKCLMCLTSSCYLQRAVYIFLTRHQYFSGIA